MSGTRIALFVMVGCAIALAVMGAHWLATIVGAAVIFLLVTERRA